jgi:Putative peptidoglycan binding domain
VTVFPYGYKRPPEGGPQGMGTLLTWDQMMTKTTVNKLHPEVRRRFRALIEEAARQGISLGCGTGWRIQPTDPNGGVLPGFSAPGNSYHEGFPANGVAGDALAIDTVPNISWTWMERNCRAYGFRTFRNVNNEPWHIQPFEITTSRNWAVNCPRLETFNLPGKPEIVYPLPTLRLGSTGTQVVMLIDHLKFWRLYPSEHMDDGNDGKFGPRTETGVMNMQMTFKVGVDGVYGPKTAGAYRSFLEAMANL